MNLPRAHSLRPQVGGALADPHHTLCRAREAEARVTQDLARLAAAIDAELGRSLSALLLLGAYARGEGSVIEDAGELQAQSCYELLAVMRSPEPNAERMARIAATWSDRLGVAVHLSAATLGDLERAAPTLTWVDVGAGQVELLVGDASVLGRLRALHPKDLPPQAWATTLCDAAVSIAAANLDTLSQAQHGPRDLHEAVLVCGDALLLKVAHYAFAADERSAELLEIESKHGVHGLASAYADALEYQKRPDRWRVSASGAGQAAQAMFRAERLALLSRVHLGLEHARVGTPRDPLGYALFPERLWSDTSYFALRALRANLRAAREGVAADGRLGDPLECLARAAMLLAYQPARITARNLAARLLGLRTTDGPCPDDAELYVRLHELREQARSKRAGDPLAGARYGRN